MELSGPKWRIGILDENRSGHRDEHSRYDRHLIMRQ